MLKGTLNGTKGLIPHYLSGNTAVLYPKWVFFDRLEHGVIHDTVLCDICGFIPSEVLSQPIHPIKGAAGSNFSSHTPSS